MAQSFSVGVLAAATGGFSVAMLPLPAQGANSVVYRGQLPPAMSTSRSKS
jgi:hypothetical protein